MIAFLPWPFLPTSLYTYSILIPTPTPTLTSSPPQVTNTARFVLTHTWTVFYMAMIVLYSAVFRYWFDFPIYFLTRFTQYEVRG